MMSEWQQQSAAQQAQAAPTAPPPQAPRVDGVPDGHGVGGTSSRNFQLDPHHFIRTIPGILKLVQIVFGIICIACAAPALDPGTDWFLFVAVVSLLITLFWCIFHLFIMKEIINLNWALIEFACLAGITVLYFIAFVVQLAIWAPVFAWFPPRGRNIAAGCFGIFNFLAYAGNCYFAFAEWRLRPNSH